MGASQRASERLLVERLTPDAGHRTPDTGHRTPDTGHQSAKHAAVVEVVNTHLRIQQEQLADECVRREIVHLPAQKHNPLRHEQTKRISSHVLRARRQQRLRVCDYTRTPG